MPLFFCSQCGNLAERRTNALLRLIRTVNSCTSPSELKFQFWSFQKYPWIFPAISAHSPLPLLVRVSVSINKEDKYVKQAHSQDRASREERLQTVISTDVRTTRKENKESHGNTKGKRHLEPRGRSGSPGGAEVLSVYKKSWESIIGLWVRSPNEP